MTAVPEHCLDGLDEVAGSGYCGSCGLLLDDRAVSREWTPEELAGWLDQVRRQCHRLTPPIDLVCAVELAGTADELDARRTLVRDLITHVQGLRPTADALRVGLAGYRDHPLPPRPDHPDPVELHLLGTTDAALGVLDRWRPASVENDLGAPVEDVLARLGEFDWRDYSVRVLVLVGLRAPHPVRHPTDDPGYNRCPRDRDWRAKLEDAEQQHGVRCVVVRVARVGVPPGNPARDDEAWERIGGHGVLTFATTTAREIAERTGMALADATVAVSGRLIAPGCRA